VLKIIRERELLRAADDAVAGPAAHLKRSLARLREIDVVGDVRGLGLMWAVEFVQARAGKEPFPAERNFAGQVAAACMERGVVVYPMQGCVDGYRGDHVMIAPPAVITEHEIDQATSAVSEAICAVRGSR
jgi:adenosylmethionine-8-amino-7-oxononanoate aminotransferase